MVKDPKLLRDAYRKSGWFKKDIISIIPTDLFYLLFPNQCVYRIPCNVIVRLNRIAKIERMFQFFDKTETTTNFPNAFRILKIVFYILVLIHWNACIYFTVSFFIGFNTDTWVYQVRIMMISKFQLNQCCVTGWPQFSITICVQFLLVHPDTDQDWGNSSAWASQQLWTGFCHR